MPTPAGPPATDLEMGEVLNGAWRLEEQIGEGGMGRVFRATDLKLSRKAAVKAVSIANLDDETVKRFEREAQVMGKLDHPGVVTLYGVGRTRGIPWLAMKYLEGRSLWGVLDEHGGRMPPEVMLAIARQLLAALSYIHGRGLLHRDLKPSNIHVGLQGRTTLLDLGLARGHETTLTRTGVVWGTPDYMAPEQIVGERQLDGRADLYSLSVVLFRMLAGAPVFADVSEQALLRAHLTRPRPDISRVVPELSPLIGAALQKGLAIRPEDRFQSADEMLVALEKAFGIVSREPPTVARPNPAVAATQPIPPTPSPARPPRRRTGETPAVDLTPKQGVRRTGEHPAATAIVKPEPIKAQADVTAPTASPLMDEDDGSGLRTDAMRLPIAGTLHDEDDEADSSRTQRAGFTPIESGSGSDSVSATPVEQPTEPSQPDARPVSPTMALEPLRAPLPLYLTPPFLIGGAVLLLVVGVLLGKFL